MSEKRLKPDFTDPLAWAKTVETHANRLRHTASQLGLDAPKLILGDVLGSIIGDDPNCFGLKSAPFMSQYASYYKESLFIRLDWEITTPELPEHIRVKLKEARTYLEQINWQTKDGFMKARDYWTREIKDFVQGEIANHPECREAYAYWGRHRGFLPSS